MVEVEMHLNILLQELPMAHHYWAVLDLSHSPWGIRVLIDSYAKIFEKIPLSG
jgi:hypothetical protein